ncbi:DUF1134 domain-containing protein [Parasphingorhabdus sp.]|uniref:DUF1134 domain-containing protein n=1 Tax=Parasphingorhabdus sp. TaxID=2709688 RepID=UPI002F91E385
MSVKKYPRETLGRKLLGLLAVVTLASAPTLAPAFAQMQTIDPNDAIDADLNDPGLTGNYDAPTTTAPPAPDAPVTGDIDGDLAQPGQVDQGTTYDDALNENSYNQNSWDQNNAAQNGGAVASAAPNTGTPVEDSATYQEDDLIGAAEGVFGKGAEGLAGLIEDLLKKQGRPNGYITGREASGAFVVGLRYGSGELHHKIEGTRPVYWTGPSVGFDVGANAANTFVLVYNLYDTEDLFKRYPAGEGAAYFVGGFHVSYLRSGDKVLIPVRMGAGLRLGANIGYMKFSKNQKWLPF